MRYVVFIALALGFAHAGYVTSAHAPNDWIIFEVGARTLIHYHHLPMYGGSPLHLYAEDPMIQIGPPALLPVVATQWMSPQPASELFVAVMAVLGVASIGFIEAAARSLTPDMSQLRRQLTVLAVGTPLAAAWGYEGGQFHHLDDALALFCVSLAVWLCATGRSAWLVGIALGLAIATKPWAIVLAPVVLGVPRVNRPKAVLGLFLTACAFWAPFVVAAPDTIHALGLFRITPKPGSILWLLGFHDHVQQWLRPVQFAAGLAAATYVGLRRGWTTAPLVGMAVRVAFDPYVYAYYGLGPVLAAVLWDFTRPTSRRLPLWTLWTLFIEFGLRLVAPPTVGAIGRVVWIVSVLAGVMLTHRTATDPAPDDVPVPPAARVPVAA